MKTDKPLSENFVSLTHRMLALMEDGRLWTRPALRTKLGGYSYDTVKGRIVMLARKGMLARADNPVYDGRDIYARERVTVPGRGGGFYLPVERSPKGCWYVYHITGQGRVLLAQFRAGTHPVSRFRGPQKTPAD